MLNSQCLKNAAPAHFFRCMLQWNIYQCFMRRKQNILRNTRKPVTYRSHFLFLSGTGAVLTQSSPLHWWRITCGLHCWRETLSYWRERRSLGEELWYVEAIWRKSVKITFILVMTYSYCIEKEKRRGRVVFVDIVVNAFGFFMHYC